MKKPDESPRLGGAIETLIRRATENAEFRECLLEERSGAAVAIGMDLHPTEKHLLDTYPADMLATITKRRTDLHQDRRGFLKAAAVVAAASGLVRGAAGETDKKDDAAAGGKVEDDPTLGRLKALKEELTTIRKQLQKETAKATKDVARRKSETEEVERKFVVVAGIPPPPERRPRKKTAAEKTRDKQELERIEALSKALEDLSAELESALLELKLKKQALEKE